MQKKSELVLIVVLSIIGARVIFWAGKKARMKHWVHRSKWKFKGVIKAISK